jgi:hypothetical protein
MARVNHENPMRHRIDPATLRRAFASADRDGDAALNWLLYGAGALLASAVLLVTTSPPIVGVLLAAIPWAIYAVAMAGWLMPAIDAQRRAAARLELHAVETRTAAADLLLSDDGTPEARRAAARLLLDGGRQ